jgi:hypothetical protein
MITAPSQLTNAALLDTVKRLAQCERSATSTLVAHLAEVERRGIFHAEGCSSRFSYCTEILKLSEHASFLRLRAARAVRVKPEILSDLQSGTLNLSSVALLEPYLSLPGASELVAAARNHSKREVERLIRARDPEPEIVASVRRLPEKRSLAEKHATTPSADVTKANHNETASVGTVSLPGLPGTPGLSGPALTALPARPQRPVQSLAPIAAERYRVQFTASREFHDQLRRMQDLLRHRVPSGDLEQVFALALAALAEKIEKRKFAATDRPVAAAAGAVRPAAGGAAVPASNRTIPATVKRAVLARDGEQCAFVSASGHRCTSRAFLEFHHVVPYARGGEGTVENIALRCRAHNQYQARLDFGPFIVRESWTPWGELARERYEA